ncbi:hypothetical protein GGC64_004556 [Mycobacterium sp. OAS707]|uniref:DUF4262 domain-containing protein n=1 Tax=Mycobacterium sp. OAS707 TaxID=2663822 RepID=UPI00178A8B36|nr:DUF4262 domain-containing protein [Mycobacterium sp. OAS707]MBE1550516.1 hypothetical protein [Mycobacterium sp. OAS707]
MCWQCDNPNGTTEEYLDELRASVRLHSWVVQGVEDDRLPFAYTIGLHDRGLPELLVTGLPQDSAAGLLNDVAAAAVGGRVFQPGAHIAVGDGPLLEIVEVDNPDAHLNFAVALGGPDIRALQLVWCDDRGRWPWAAGWGPGQLRQPVLGKRALRRRSGGTGP